MIPPLIDTEPLKFRRLVLAKILGGTGGVLIMIAGAIGASIISTTEIRIPPFFFLGLAALASGVLMARGERIILNRWITYPRTWMLATPALLFLAVYLYDQLTLRFLDTQAARLQGLVLTGNEITGLLRASFFNGAGIGLAGGLLVGFVQSRLLRNGRGPWILVTVLMYLLAGAVIAYALTQIHILLAQMMNSIPLD